MNDFARDVARYRRRQRLFTLLRLVGLAALLAFFGWCAIVGMIVIFD